MKIRFLSDLHLEFGNVPDSLPSVGEDVVVLAGDIGSGDQGIRWARRAIPDRPVLYVMGNHEAYDQNLDRLWQQAAQTALSSHVTLLENQYVVIGGVRFVGATLWTDFALLGESLQAQSMQLARAVMNDYRCIRLGEEESRRMQPEDTLAFHRESRAFLEQAIAQSSEPVVVITHHGPFAGASAPQYADDPVSPAFNSDLTALMRDPVKAWIFGHTHHGVEARIGDTLVVSNQRGYPHEPTEGFRWDRCIEVLPDLVKGAEPC